jgi:hypothetical protein
MTNASFPIKDATASRVFSFNFQDQLAVGETISSATVAATVYSGTDASPSSIISGAASISGATVSQVITAGTAGVTYVLTCTAVTSTSHTIVSSGPLVVM